MSGISESSVEEVALDWLENLGWNTAHGADIAPDISSERADYGKVVLAQRLQNAINRLNPDLPPSAIDDAFRKPTQPEGSALEIRSHAFHRMATEGITTEYQSESGEIRGVQAQVFDFNNPSNNDWLAVITSYGSTNNLSGRMEHRKRSNIKRSKWIPIL